MLFCQSVSGDVTTPDVSSGSPTQVDEGATAAAVRAATTSKVAAAMPPGSPSIAHPVVAIDETATLARLPQLLSRMLLGVVPGDKMTVDIILAALENACINRAREAAL